MKLLKLNPDCIRDILLTIEEVTDFNNAFEYPENEHERLEAYPENEVLYHLKQCNEHKLVLKYQFFMDNTIGVEDLSPKGHDFLSTIRTNKNWDKIKKVFLESGKYTLSNLISVAVSSITKNNFGI